jgi:transposase
MQDHAPGYTIKFIINELKSRGINLIFWPFFLPDLNLIKTVWDIIKNWIQDNYLDNKLNYKVLRQVVIKTWEAIEEREFKNLLALITERYQIVITANGLHTKF